MKLKDHAKQEAKEHTEEIHARKPPSIMALSLQGEKDKEEMNEKPFTLYL